MSLSNSRFPALSFDVGAVTLDSFPSSLPTRLTLKSSASTFADPNHSPYNDDLLTPPLTSPSLDEPPFRPAESDRTSLSMRRHREFSQQRRRRHNRACVSSGDVDQTALYHECPRRILSLSRSRSAPSLTNLTHLAFGRKKSCNRGSSCLDANYTHDAEPTSRCDSLSKPKHPRRWTISGKAAPTRVLTSISPSAVLPDHNGTANDKAAAADRPVVETPAMITLQRAASSKSRRTSLRPDAYTSFPTPTFSKTRSGFVTTFFGDGWPRSDNTRICTSVVKSASVTGQSHCTAPRSARASVDHGNVRPSHSTTASPVCTGIVIDPFIQGQMTESQRAFRARRCSTKYVSGVSTYEIIWDENVSTSSSGASRRTSTRQTRRASMRDNEFEPTRRLSVAVDKLETQLSKGIEQPSKNSSAPKGRAASKSGTQRGTSQKSFHNMLNFQEAGRNAEEESEILIRSRASTTSKQKPTSSEIEVHLTTMMGDETSSPHMGFFPPLTLGHTNLDAPTDLLLVNPWRTSGETTNDAVAPLPAKYERRGSMIGQSTGLRKKSVCKQAPGISRKAGIARKKISKPVEEDQVPLLGRFNNWSDEAIAGSCRH